MVGVPPSKDGGRTNAQQNGYQRLGVEANNALPPIEVPPYTVTSGADGLVYEGWRFENDTYALGLYALVFKPLRSSIPDLLVAVCTPFLSVLAIKVIMYFLFEGEEDGDVSIVVRSICFILAALAISNEAAEGFSKMAFCTRCIAGTFDGVSRPRMMVALILSNMQVLVSFLTMALNMRLVASAEGVVDAFLNFVAVGFLSEIDNLIMSSVSVQAYFPDSLHAETFKMVRSPGASSKFGRMSFPILLCVNAVIAQGLAAHIFFQVLIGSIKDPDASFDWQSQLPNTLLAVLIINIVALLGGRVAPLFKVVHMFSLLTASAYILSPSDLNGMTTMVFMMFALEGVAGSVAADAEPFEVLTCPYRVPILMWLMLGCATVRVARLQELGYT